MRGRWLVVVVAVMGCSRCKHETPRILADPAIDAGSDVDASDADADASSEPKKGTLGSCFEPRAIVRRDDLAGAGALLAGDPLTASTMHHEPGDDDVVVHFGPRTYRLADDDPCTVVAVNGEVELWRRPNPDVTHQVIDLSISPAGGVLVATFMGQFPVRLVDTGTGRVLLADAEPNLLFAPGDAFALEVPQPDVLMDEAAQTYDTHDVVLLELSNPIVRHTVATLPLTEEWDAEGYPPWGSTYGAEICSTGATFVVSFPTTELAVYRAKDRAQLAAIASPGAGMPVFSRSGRFVALRDEEQKITALFELLPPL